MLLQVLKTAIKTITITTIKAIITTILIIVIIHKAVLKTKLHKIKMQLRFYSYNPNSVPTEQEPVQSGSYPSYANTDDTAAENNSAPSEEVNSEVDEYYHPTVQSPEANDEIPSVEVQDNENEQQPLDENTDINE